MKTKGFLTFVWYGWRDLLMCVERFDGYLIVHAGPAAIELDTHRIFCCKG